jgi:hypothetical protein
MEWTKDQYNKQYEKWVPWLEDMYLYYFTKDNKASYTAKGASPLPSYPFRFFLPPAQI